MENIVKYVVDTLHMFTVSAKGKLQKNNKTVEIVDLEKALLTYAREIRALSGTDVWDLDFPKLHKDLIRYIKQKNSVDGGIENPEQLAYNEIRDLLPYVWYANSIGEMRFYREKKPGVPGEVEALAVSDIDTIISSLRANADLYAKLLIIKDNFSSTLSMTAFLKLALNGWLNDVSRSLKHEPSLISKNPSEYTFKYINMEHLEPGPTPNWDELLNRIDYPDILLAWVWSIFEPKDMGRQALWIHGGGFDGKSTFAAALKEIVGSGVTAISQRNYEKEFFFNNVYGKRLAIYGDCKNPRVIQSEKVHSMLGGDLVSVEAKGENAFAGFVFCKMLILSNMSPIINVGQGNELSRILYLTISPNTVKEQGDFYFKDKLVAEAMPFLYRCREAYGNLAANGPQLKMPKAMYAALARTTDGGIEDLIVKFMKTKIEYGAEYSCDQLEIVTEVKLLCKEHMFDRYDTELVVRGIKAHMETNGAVWRDKTEERSAGFNGARLRTQSPIALKGLKYVS